MTIETVVEYIKCRCESDYQGRPHEGARIINNYMHYGADIELLTVRAVAAASSAFQRARKKSGGAFKLTNTSLTVGLHVITGLGVTNTNHTELLRVGDLFMEAFFQLGFISIEREYEGYRAPYVIRLEDSWATLGDLPPEYEGKTLIGTSFSRFNDITSLRNELTKRPYIKRMSSESDFSQVIDAPFVNALNKLQQTPWRLNTKLLGALEENIHNFLDLEDTSTKAKSKSIEMKFVISKAHAIGKREFYQAVECDYRGRIYYTEPFLNFQGSDIAKGLFEFSYGKPMDDHGFRWLCIHTACSYNQSYHIDEIPNWVEVDYCKHLQEEGLDTISVDKMTLRDREQWTLQNLDWLHQLADGQTFRMEAEKPVSFLGCCLELKGYADAVSNSVSYISHLPIPVDGSNNGWQHLAAMSKDKQAGDLVSLVPRQVQRDFYVQVAKRLIERMPEWFEERQMPMKSIRKGIAKRGSMTRAYSAGQRKIAENMFYDCKTEGYDKKYNISEEDCAVLARNLILAINDTCVGPLKTMKFLQKITDHILSQGEKELSWVTPSGFPVLYEVWRQRNLKIRGTIRGIGRISHQIKVPVLTKEGELVPCRRSFASGCSPNFVHSMDASHMARVIDSFTGDFGAIHDSYSTHASDVDRLLEHTKWQFAMMYNKQNFFRNIEDMLLNSREDYEVVQPKLGDLDISEIISSDYFFC